MTKSEASKKNWQNPEYRNKVIQALKGKKCLDETKQKISESNKGKSNPCAEKTRRKISKKLSGRYLSEEHKKKLSDSKKGNKNPMFGKPHTEEHNRKISASLKGKKKSPFSEEHKKKISKAQKGKNNSLFGKHHSKETRKKMSEALRGKKSYCWKGGLTPLVIRIRNCFKYRQWRSDIFIRDDFTCVLCNKRGYQLEVDHYPKSFSEIFHGNKIKTIEKALKHEELWDINNGRTLCFNCHRKKEDKLRNE